MSVLLPPGGSLSEASQQLGLLRAYSDPVIFRDDRVLKTLLRKEIKYLPGIYNLFCFQNLGFFKNRFLILIKVIVGSNIIQVVFSHIFVVNIYIEILFTQLSRIAMIVSYNL